MSSTTRTTFFLRIGLLERLKQFAREQDRTMGDVVEQSISQLLEQSERKQRQKMYEEMSMLVGISRIDIPNASAIIDKTLYGEAGDWRGHAK